MPAPTWILDPRPRPSARNAFVRFRRVFPSPGQPLRIRITADSRYWLWINGERLGSGPVRSLATALEVRRI